MRFYTNFELYGSTLLLREVNNGVRSKRKVKIAPTLYIQSDKSPSGFKTQTGESLSSVEFDSIKDAKEFIGNYTNNNFPVYGFNRWQYTKIDELFPGNGTEYDPSLVNIAFLDIETECSAGFPIIETANEAINAITIASKGKSYTLGLQKVSAELPEGAVYKPFNSEYELLKAFLTLWERLDIDIISGWNIDFFDLPYLYQRIVRVLGEDEVKRLSPWGLVERRQVKVMGRVNFKTEITGLAVIDYIDIYKKFRMKMQESYKLDHIAYVELGERKLEFEGSLHELYKTDYDTFILYNIKDVNLIVQLEEKLKYISLCMTIAYFTKVNFEDVYSNVRMWDVVIANYLRDRKIQVRSNVDKEGDSDEPYEGAFVKDPKVGKYDWIVSFDLTSLYPSLIRTFNISPDVDENKNIIELFDGVKRQVDADFVVDNDEIMSKVTEFLQENNLSMASNGTLYSRNKMGFLADLMAQYFDYRKQAKKKMLEIDTKIQEINKILKDRGL